MDFGARKGHNETAYLSFGAEDRSRPPYNPPELLP
jgi:hypothetical protein